jgi:hypothetical protein
MSTKEGPSQAVHRPAEAARAHIFPQAVDEGINGQHTSTPPPYSGPASPSAQRPSASPPNRALPQLNYALYAPPNFKLSDDETTITTYRPEPNQYPAALISMIRSQSALPPKLQLHIKGTSLSGALDFHLKLNLMHLLVGHPSDPSQRWNYLQCPEPSQINWPIPKSMTMENPPPTGIALWAALYCADHSSIKQFTLERVVSNLDTQYLEGRLHSLIASVSYRGNAEISFPLTHNKVVVHSPDKVNRLFTNMTHLFTGTKKCEVVKAVWPFASAPPDAPAAERRFAVMSEEQWWGEWKDAIRGAMLNKRKGWVTVEDQIELLMAPRETKKPAEWGI